MGITLQDSLDDFIVYLQAQNIESLDTEQHIALFAEYLLHYSDLFQEGWVDDEGELDEWELNLHQQMEQLLQEEDGVDESLDLGNLPLDEIDVDHLSDFLGWFLLREPNMDSLQMGAAIETMQHWLQFVYQQKWMDDVQYDALFSTMSTLAPESIRVVKAARLLFHFVRMGGCGSPRLRGERFERFIEGHARVVHIGDKSLQLAFDNSDDSLDEVMVPNEILEFLQVGDVIDIELGLRGNSWTIVDIGPVYPRYIYMSAESVDMENKFI
ncbi:MAG: hypothetical protein HQM07_01155 [Zetaproteobacteria bacterium]|nr:hypothetical protein [Zetaproteobacteria bacterium]